jgi:hypothetical protein
VSIDFTILCTLSPLAFLKKKARWLEWDAKKKSGSFGGMSLSLRSLEEWDELPDPSFAERVVAVVHADGRLGDDTYDDFDAWTRALAEATRGAIHSLVSGEFLYVWADAEEEQTRARARDYLDAGDFDALAAWIAALGAAHAKARHDPDPAWSQLGWIDELAVPVIEQRIAAGDGRAAPALVALHRVFKASNHTGRLDPLVVSAARFPALADDKELQVIAENLEAARLDALARSLPLPADLAELELLLDGVLREDRFDALRFQWFAGPHRDYMTRRQELLVALAASGRALSEPLVRRLAGLVYYVESLRSEEGREELARHGALGKAIGDAVRDSQRRYEESERSRHDTVARARAENDALHGIKRDRPRTPEAVIALVRRGDLAAAVVRYRELCPDNGSQAEQAIEDAREYFKPS